MFKIGNIEIKNQVIVAPMAGVSNIAFRSIMKEMGAGLIYAEMVSDKALAFSNIKTYKMLEVVEEEKPLVMQIFGSEVETMVKGAKIIDENSACDIIDINLGCPVTKVVKSGAGSKLMQDPQKVYEIVKAVVENVSKPVTVKMRAGWNTHSINAVEIAQLCEKAGAKAIAVHGRTRAQLYHGHADWDIIRQVKNAVSIPVFGNGDIKKPEDARRMLEETGVDAIMIGRAVLGNPWLIKQTVDYLENGEYDITDDLEERLKYALDHMDRLISLKGEKIGMLEMRNHGAWYVKGLPGATKIKKEMASIKERNDLINLFNEYREYIKTDHS